MSLPIEDGIPLIAEARTQNHRAEIFQQWVVQLPFMGEEFVSFQDYYDRLTGKNIDLRPTEELMAELDAVESLFEEGENHHGNGNL